MKSIIAALVVLGLGPLLQAQKLIFSVRPSAVLIIAGVGDITGDGFGDVAFRGRGPDPANPRINTDYLELRSGKDWRLIWKVPATVRSIASAGDVNKDGVLDIVVGAFGDPGSFTRPPTPGSVTVFSGKDGSVIHRWIADNPADAYFGEYVSGGLDVNGDGYPDFASSSSNNNFGTSYAIVFSGKDGSILYRIDDSPSRERIGSRGCWIIGDLNSDGHADFAVPAPWASHGGTHTGSVYIHSGKDGSLLYRLDGRAADVALGWRFIVLGDVDKDGIPDFAIGSYRSPFWQNWQTGYIEIFSGRNGRSLLYLEGPSSSCAFGWELVAIGDTNGDGFVDFMTRSGSPNASGTDRSVLLSPADGRVLRTYLNQDRGIIWGGGPQFIAVGDVDGDGLADLGLWWSQKYSRPSRWLEIHSPFGTVPLQADKSQLSLSRGESLMFSLDGGKPMANQMYVMLGSMTGTLLPPEFLIGPVHLPLKQDLYFNLAAVHGGNLHQRPMGRMDGNGRMNSSFKLDPRFPTELIGLKLYHAFLGFSFAPPGILFASNAVETEIVR